MSSQTAEAYFGHYTSIQEAKLRLLRQYLEGWLPKLSSISRELLYVDCHAGRGKYKTGEPGSPLVALTTLRDHSRRDDLILANCRVHFLFLDNNANHVKTLEAEVKALGSLPPGMTYEIRHQDFEPFLRGYLDQRGRSLPPSFFFFDPFSYRLPMDLLQRVLSYPRSELLVTFMVRFVTLAITRPGHASNLDKTFGSNSWRRLRETEHSGQRYAAMTDLYKQSLGCKYPNILHMRGRNREPKYVLVHATNHPAGCELMKDTLWRITPDGSFAIYQSLAGQPRLFWQPPDLKPLEDQLLADHEGLEVRYRALEHWLLPLPWRVPHLNQKISELVQCGQIEIGGSGRFVASRNQLLRFPSRQN